MRPTGIAQIEMSTTIETITTEALHLSQEQRLTLAHRMLASVEPAANPAVAAAWDSEIQERIRKYDSGESVAIPGEDVFAEVDSRLKQ